MKLEFSNLHFDGEIQTTWQIRLRICGDFELWVGEQLTRISHSIKRIGAPNQRKLFCEKNFRRIRGAPRCRQSVAQNRLAPNCLSFALWKAAPWWRDLTEDRSRRMAGLCCWARRTGRSGWLAGLPNASSIGGGPNLSSILCRRWSGNGYSGLHWVTRTSTTTTNCGTI